MKEGRVKSEISKVLMYGAPGTGKSSSMDLFVGNPPKCVRVSTPLAARPVTMCQMDLTRTEWMKLTPEERKKALARATVRLARLRVEDRDSGEDSGSNDEVLTEIQANENTDGSNREEDTSSRPDENPQFLSVSPMAAESGIKTSVSRSSQKTSLPSISTHEDLMQLMDECSMSDKDLPTFRKINLIDSGGQPQFHEVLPIFLRHTSLYIFVFKLSEELTTKPMVEYFGEDGKCVGTPYQSAHSNEQLLKYCLRALHTHRCSPKDKDAGGEATISTCSKIMIVGTHRDEEHLCTTETRKEKNKKLAELLLPMFKDEVVYYNLPEKELIFPINARNPKESDQSTAKSIQGIVLTECSPVPIDVPLRYFSLEILLEEVSISLGRGVLSKRECLDAADKLNFDDHTLVAALQFLDEISVVFYFPEILGNVVFTNPQILLDKVTELVQKIYYLRLSNGKDSVLTVSGRWQKFRDHGILSLELLQLKEFNEHYIPDIFTAVDLIKLFKKLLIIARFSASEYMMPALLPVLETEKVQEYRVLDDSLVAPLVLAFPLGGPRLGTYCSLSCFLVSNDNQFPCPWEIVLLPCSNTPLHLASIETA